MKMIKHHAWGPVKAYEVGYMLVGSPMMTAIFYVLDHLVIDTGIGHLRREIVSLFSDKHIQRVILTHCHEDHSGNAAALKQTYGVDIFGHPYTVEKMRRKLITLPYQRLIWGRSQNVDIHPYPESIETEIFRLTPIPTPGHSKDHTAYLEADRGWLFSGDLYLADKIKFFRKDENIHDEIQSLKTTLRYNFDTLFCAHNPQERHAKERLRAKLDFLENIVGEANRLQANGLTVPDIIKTLQTTSDTFIRWFTMGNVGFGHIIRSALFDRPSHTTPDL